MAEVVVFFVEDLEGRVGARLAEEGGVVAEASDLTYADPVCPGDERRVGWGLGSGPLFGGGGQQAGIDALLAGPGEEVVLVCVKVFGEGAEFGERGGDFGQGGLEPAARLHPPKNQKQRAEFEYQNLFSECWFPFWEQAFFHYGRPFVAVDI